METHEPVKIDNPIKRGMDAALRAAEFLRKTNTWYRELQETIQVVELQQSNFSKQLFVNIGVLVKGVGATARKVPPGEHECHIRVRIEGLGHPENEDATLALFNLEDDSAAGADRQSAVEEVVNGAVVPLLRLCSTRAGISAAYREGRLARAIIDKDVRALFVGSLPRLD